MTGGVLVSGRVLDEYRAMFLLGDADLLTGRLLDCPGGAGSFGAEVRDLGGCVVSVDPVYALPADRLALLVRAEADRTSAFVEANPARYRWSRFASVAEHLQTRRAAVERFVANFAADRRWYLPAALPDLPFGDGVFTFALCGYLLFAYPQVFDVECHVASLRALARVAGEARVFPLVDAVGGPYPQLDVVRARLDRLGVASELRRSGEDFQRGADTMLVLHGPHHDRPERPGTVPVAAPGFGLDPAQMWPAPSRTCGPARKPSPAP